MPNKSKMMAPVLSRMHLETEKNYRHNLSPLLTNAIAELNESLCIINNKLSGVEQVKCINYRFKD